MAWLSNHSLNALLTGAAEIDRLRRRCCGAQQPCDSGVCQDSECLGLLMRNQLHWGGVYAVDKLPKKNIPRHVSYIVNTARASSAGEHWLALRLTPDRLEFFDSYGQPPWHYPLIYAWIQQRQLPCNYLKQRIQGPKAYCGAYCYYFLTERPFHSSLYETLFTNPRFVFTSLDPFVSDPTLIKGYLSHNDTMVFDYLFRQVKRLLSIYDCE